MKFRDDASCKNCDRSEKLQPKNKELRKCTMRNVRVPTLSLCGEYVDRAAEKKD